MRFYVFAYSQDTPSGGMADFHSGHESWTEVFNAIKDVIHEDITPPEFFDVLDTRDNLCHEFALYEDKHLISLDLYSLGRKD